MDDLQARLDRAITEAREGMRAAAQDWALYFDPTAKHIRRTFEEREADYDASVETFAALVALRARYETARHYLTDDPDTLTEWEQGFDAEAERLLGKEDA